MITDHTPLCYMMQMTHHKAMLSIWCLELQSYDFKPIYKPGNTNRAEGLSHIFLKVEPEEEEFPMSRIFVCLELKGEKTQRFPPTVLFARAQGEDLELGPIRLATETKGKV